MDSKIIKSQEFYSTKLLSNFRASLRRHYVDDFFLRKISDCSPSDRLLDLAGNKLAKRGVFNIDEFNNRVIYANYSVDYRPDIQADAHAIPFMENSFDCVVCGELLEHVKDPAKVIAEVFRILVSDGRLLITVPFMYPIHADPMDYGRYTDYFWQETLVDSGFNNVVIEWQGGFWSVLFDMLRGWAFEKEEQSSGNIEKTWNWLNVHMQQSFKKRAVKWDAKSDHAKTFFMKGCTTGFGISCHKP